MCDMTGYQPKTTFWEDFSIAECFGREAIRTTFKHAFNEWRSNYIYLTELVMVLNWKVWLWHEENGSIAQTYNEFFETADRYALDNLRGDALQYFLKTVD